MGIPKIWTCLKCSEEVEEQFAVCWNCQADRNGRFPSPTLSNEDIAEARAKAFLTEKHRPKQCHRCNVTLHYAGTKDFHEGTNLGVFGQLGELLINRTRLDMQVCPQCFCVEFFLADP